jgi:teichuronic acid biosynthesis glycosyltransferase TuaC
VRVLVVSHLYPWPGGQRHLFVHQQVLALRELGVESHVLSPTPWAPRALWRSERQRRRGRKPREAVLDGVSVEYPRVVQPPKRLFFDRLGDLAYQSVRRLPSERSAGYDLVHAHQALPDGALGARLAADLGVPLAITVHGADVYQHLRAGGAVERRARQVLGGADVVMANSSVVARLLSDVVEPDCPSC